MSIWFWFFMTVSDGKNLPVFAVISWFFSSDSVFQCLGHPPSDGFFSVGLSSEQDGNLAATASINLLSGRYGQRYALIEPSSPPLHTRPRSLAPSRYDNASSIHAPAPTQARWRWKKRGVNDWWLLHRQPGTLLLQTVDNSSFIHLQTFCLWLMLSQKSC